jgi:starvation-inducible outer membrane lipoprotein
MGRHFKATGRCVMTFNPLIIVATALALSACEASPPTQSNARARVLKWFATNANAVQAEADRHCKQYGKLARVTEMRTDAGGRVLFECA